MAPERDTAVVPAVDLVVALEAVKEEVQVQVAVPVEELVVPARVLGQVVEPAEVLVLVVAPAEVLVLAAEPAEVLEQVAVPDEDPEPVLESAVPALEMESEDDSSFHQLPGTVTSTAPKPSWILEVTVNWRTRLKTVSEDSRRNWRYAAMRLLLFCPASAHRACTLD